MATPQLVQQQQIRVVDGLHLHPVEQLVDGLLLIRAGQAHQLFDLAPAGVALQDARAPRAVGANHQVGLAGACDGVDHQVD